MSTSLLSVALLGLLAGGVSCGAVQGALLAGLVSRQRSGASAGVRGDLAPAGGFLAGKLASHALLGALLGGLGAVVRLSVQARATAQLAAGALIVVMGLAQLEVPGFRRLVLGPPASWGRLVRGRARSVSMFAPAALGLSTVLIPCGVTLSVMALAITSGSPLHGAVVMTVFVAGTAPLFTVLGYVAARARRTAGPWRRRLAVLTGVVVLAAGLYTLQGGLELAGSPLPAGRMAAALGLGGDPARAADPPDGPLVTVADGHQTVVVIAVTAGYQPANLEVAAGVPTTLVVRAKKARGCVRAFVIPGRDVERILPMDGDTTIDLGVLHPGELRYSCGMGMYTGQLTVVAGP